jgi:hypothetical protein
LHFHPYRVARYFPKPYSEKAAYGTTIRAVIKRKESVKLRESSELSFRGKEPTYCPITEPKPSAECILLPILSAPHHSITP